MGVTLRVPSVPQQVSPQGKQVGQSTLRREAQNAGKIAQKQVN